jgi:hypothetical protein
MLAENYIGQVRRENDRKSEELKRKTKEEQRKRKKNRTFGG